jgi:uncharacterized protein
LALLNNTINSENIKITYRNFRPNVVFTDCGPFDEDNWEYIRINNVNLRFLNPCSRCLLTTVNPVTAEKGDEPLLTLRKFRLGAGKFQKLFGQSPLFGVYFMPENGGILHVNDSIWVHRKNMVQCSVK